MTTPSYKWMQPDANTEILLAISYQNCWERRSFLFLKIMSKSNMAEHCQFKFSQAIT